MGLADLIPTFRGALQSRLEDKLWPPDAVVNDRGELVVGGVDLGEIAVSHGTPAYVVDEDDFRRCARAYRAALPEAEILHAAKTLLCRGVLDWALGEGLVLGVTAGAELALARAAGFPGSRIVLHGNAKAPEDFKAALAYPVDRIVVDTLDEVRQLQELATYPQDVVLRLSFGRDEPFGFSIPNDSAAGGSAADVVRRLAAQPTLRPIGVRCHLGSRISRVIDVERAVREVVRFSAWARDEHGMSLGELHIGGGHVVPYLHGEPDFDVTGCAMRLRVALHDECARHRVEVPALVVEPGRALIARAGISLLRVAAVHRGKRVVVTVDGGPTGGLCPTRCASRHSMRMIGRVPRAAKIPVAVIGRHWEPEDVVEIDAVLPDDVRVGDVVAVACTGAYHHWLEPDHNLTGRPPVIAVSGGVSRVLVRRESDDDMLARDVG